MLSYLYIMYLHIYTYLIGIVHTQHCYYRMSIKNKGLLYLLLVQFILVYDIKALLVTF